MARVRKIDPVQATRFTAALFKAIDTIAAADDLRSLDVLKLRTQLNSIKRAVNKMWPDQNDLMMTFMRVGAMYNAGLLPFLSNAHVASERMKAALDIARVQSRKPSKRRKRA